MEEQNMRQVQLSKLIFTHNWEDPAVDEQALKIKEGESVFTITSGGCNTLGFLRFEPSRIFCVDINPAQTFLMELKKAAFQHLSQEEVWRFFGLIPGSDRIDTFRKLKSSLSEEAKLFFDSRPEIIRKGLIMNGRYERFVRLAGKLIKMLQGGKKTEKFFTLPLAEQRAYYDQYWNNRRWKWIFSTMFNKKRLAKKGLNADYFHFDDGSKSFSESFHRRAEHALTDLPIQSNYFLSLYLLGRYHDRSSIPAYLLPENFEAIQKNIEKVEAITADSKYWLEQQPDNSFDAMALSNICELMDETDTLKLFTEVVRTAKPGARIVFRNLMIPREVPTALQNVVVKDIPLSKELQYNDRSFVYGKVAAYTINK